MKNRYVRYKGYKYRGYKIEFVEHFYTVDDKVFEKLPDAIKYVDIIVEEKQGGNNGRILK